MSLESPFDFDRQRLFTDLGTLILTRFLATRPGSVRVENVEQDRAYQKRGIDLIWRRAMPGHEQTAVEIKCDAHAGDDETLIRSPDHPYYAKRTDNFAVETVSNDASGAPGWIFGSEAGMLLYYFVAIPHTVGELRAWQDAGEENLLAHMRITGDRLYVLDLPELREWFTGVQEKYREVPAQNESYRTLSRLVPCGDVLDAVTHCHVFEDVHWRVISAMLS